MPTKEKFRQAYAVAKECVIWMALGLLIKGHNDLNFNFSHNDVVKVPVSDLSVNNVNAKMNFSTLSIDPSRALPSTVVAGNLTVMGCVLIRQNGIYQNSCTIFDLMMRGCVHGVVDFGLTKSICRCEPHWTGGLCDRHDCYLRGEWQLGAEFCLCDRGYDSATNCKTRQVFHGCSTFGGNCQGVCVGNTCVCTLAGQVGRNCYRCASPVIDGLACPARYNWGVDFVNPFDGFGICGGGYEPNLPDLVVIRGLDCNRPNCRDFYMDRAFCCNPFAASDLRCSLWRNWTYTQAAFLSTQEKVTGVFNAPYRRRYLEMLRNHFDGCSDGQSACLLRAWDAVQSGSWAQLSVDTRPNAVYTIGLDGQFLTVGSQEENTVAAAIWDKTAALIYLIGSGAYSGLTQLQFILTYTAPYTYCLAGQDADTFTLTRLGFRFQTQTMYWINLRDQPGSLLPMHGYCGAFLTLGNTFKRLSISRFDYPGTTPVGGANWWMTNQGVVIATRQ